MRAKCFDDYSQERQALSVKEIDRILEKGRKWNLASTLVHGGVIVFPHTFLHSCGSHTAAAVSAALDSGSDQVLVLGVLHASTKEQKQARALERSHKAICHTQLQNIYGPDLQGSDQLEYEYSLANFLFLFDEEVKRRGGEPPKLYCRYPFLMNRQPQCMRGMQALKKLAKDCVIIATADLSHHGIAYGATKETALSIGPKAAALAKANVEKHLDILQKGTYDAYYSHCLAITSDAYDVGSTIKHIVRPKESKILDMKLVDTSILYDATPGPSWVAASLVTLSP